MALRVLRGVHFPWVQCSGATFRSPFRYRSLDNKCVILSGGSQLYASRSRRTCHEDGSGKILQPFLPTLTISPPRRDVTGGDLSRRLHRDRWLNGSEGCGEQAISRSLGCASLRSG